MFIKSFQLVKTKTKIKPRRGREILGRKWWGLGSVIKYLLLSFETTKNYMAPFPVPFLAHISSK